VREIGVSKSKVIGGSAEQTTVCGEEHGFSAWRVSSSEGLRRFCLGEAVAPCGPWPVMAANETQFAGPVLLFDGECALCRTVVRALLRLDRRGALRFAALQGALAQEFLRKHGLPTRDFDTLIFLPDWSRREAEAFLRRSEGAVAALRCCGGAASSAGRILAAVPARWRDAAYQGVARWRRRLFGAGRPGDAWREPWRDRFLDQG
jgi:predicted DCC family thiol-disulfide oxidoreductase YuxK